MSMSEVFVPMPTVMAGLVPAIHVFLDDTTKQDVDARHKAGHDERGGERRPRPFEAPRLIAEEHLRVRA